MNLIFLGAPGAGKGTQAAITARHFDLAHIATGVMLREEMQRKTAVGVQIQSRMDAGLFVPDDVVCALTAPCIAAAENENGYVLDGFPRNFYQAEKLQTLTKRIDTVIQIDVADSVIIERMSGRLVCPACGATFHADYNPPRTENICCTCAAKLIQRADDKPETVRRRLEIYHNMTKPIVDFYDKQGLLVNLSGVGEVCAITESILAALKARL